MTEAVELNHQALQGLDKIRKNLAEILGDSPSLKQEGKKITIVCKLYKPWQKGSNFEERIERFEKIVKKVSSEYLFRDLAEQITIKCGKQDGGCVVNIEFTIQQLQSLSI